MDNKVRVLIDSLHAMAEMLSVYENALIDNGFSRKEAFELCKEYQRTLLGSGKKDGGQNG